MNVAAAPAAPSQTVALRARAEVALTCPGCGTTGKLRRVGGGLTASRFYCEAYVYNPSAGNQCRFRFLVDDRVLARFR